MSTPTSRGFDLVALGCQEVNDWLDHLEELLDFLAANHLSPDSDDIPADLAASAGNGVLLPDLNGHLVDMLEMLQQQCALAERHPQIRRMIAQVAERVERVSDAWVIMLVEHGLVNE